MVVTIKIPSSAQILVKNDQRVDFGDELFELQKKSDMRIAIASKLKIAPEHIFKYLNRVIGEDVRAGELLASKKGVLTTKKVYSPREGIIKEISHLTGEIILSVSQDSNQVDQEVKKAFFKGKIVDRQGDTFKVEINNGETFPLKTVSEDGGGKAFYFANESFYFTTDEDQLKDKIIVIDELKSHIEVKCETLGSAGFLFLKGKASENLPSASFSKIQDYDTMISLNKKYILFSKDDAVLVVYD